MGERLDVVLVLRQESIWDEGLGIWPVVRVMVNGPDRHLDQVTGLESKVSAGQPGEKSIIHLKLFNREIAITLPRGAEWMKKK